MTIYGNNDSYPPLWTFTIFVAYFNLLFLVIQPTNYDENLCFGRVKGANSTNAHKITIAPMIFNLYSN